VKGAQCVVARDLFASRSEKDVKTHLPEDLVIKMSPHYQPEQESGSSTSGSGFTSSDFEPVLATTLLVSASSNANLMDLERALKDADPDDECAAHGASPLHLLAATHAEPDNALACVRLLLESGASVNKRASNGSTPLHWAAGNGNVEVAELLLSNGADPTIQTFTWFRDVFGKHSGQTALHWASESGYVEIVSLLLDHAPWIIGCSDERGSTSYELAMREAKFDALDLLKERAEVEYVLLRAKMEGIVTVPLQ
jgi:ankyrin repeat protein